MSESIAIKIHNDPRFAKLVKERDRLGWILSAIVCVMYFGFTLMIAYTPGILTAPIAADSVIPMGMPIGIGIIVMSCILTGIYVYKANNTYDPIMREIMEEATK
ncbi:DUF485 domain-containing protein [Geobacter sp. AOG2]|uniref:DUF485 domain-containing protein n=1 Tax=Geobacter sp. AOG2 TaxID=1566347 RepID=UPI001CC6A4FE|nr:DUF485 domain-containing protein [Geobacter sp. AOG2]GFE61773.1 membrane protein [Geobacter sp. AOG2]